MKYEIIYTEDCALIVSDEEIKPGDFNVPSDCNKSSDISRTSEEDLSIVNDKFNGYKKIIGHRPFTDAAILEGVPLLHEFTQEDDVEDLALAYSSSKGYVNPEGYSDKQVGLLHGFIDGYNKAKETYKYTEEDLINAMYKGNQLSKKFGSRYMIDLKDISDYIQSLQQSKRPKYFECETIYRVKSGTIQEHKDGFAGFEYHEPKSVTNSQNQKELVGTYQF